MKFSRLIGRVLLAILFINVGLSQLNNPGPFTQFVNVRFPYFIDYVQKLTGNSLDQLELLKPHNFIQHTYCIIQTLGVAQVVLGIGVGLGIQGAGYLLALLSIIITAFAHNPIIYPNNVNAEAEYINVIFNVGIIGALLLVVKTRKNKASCGVKCCLTTSKEKKLEDSPKKVNAEDVKTKGANPKSK